MHIALQARLIKADGSSVDTLVAPLTGDADASARLAAGAPLLNFAWNSPTANATHDTVYLTYVPEVRIAGNATLAVVSAEPAPGGGTVVAGAPLALQVVPGALVSATFTLDTLPRADKGVNVGVVAMVRPR
jgi:hypothetical protein